MQPNPSQFQAVVGDKTVTYETGHLAGQAGGALTVQLGNTLVFAAATMSNQSRPGIDFLPLMVDYEERMYAGGRIPGSFFRREGRPTEQAILTARLTDRSLRPLFVKEMRNDIQASMKAIEGQMKVDQKRLEGPLVAKLGEIIEDVGKSQGFTMILRRGAPGVLYTREALDITDTVIEKYNSKS